MLAFATHYDFSNIFLKSRFYATQIGNHYFYVIRYLADNIFLVPFNMNTET